MDDNPQQPPQPPDMPTPPPMGNSNPGIITPEPFQPAEPSLPGQPPNSPSGIQPNPVPKVGSKTRLWLILAGIATIATLAFVAVVMTVNHSGSSTPKSGSSSQNSENDTSFAETTDAWKDLGSTSHSLRPELFVYTKPYPSGFGKEFPNASEKDAAMLAKGMTQFTLDLNGQGESDKFFSGLSSVDQIVNFKDEGTFILRGSDSSVNINLGGNDPNAGTGVRLEDQYSYPTTARSVWVSSNKDTQSYGGEQGGDFYQSTYYKGYKGALAKAKTYAQSILNQYVITGKTDLVSNYTKYLYRKDTIADGWMVPEDYINYDIKSNGAASFTWNSEEGAPLTDIPDNKIPTYDIALTVGTNKDGSLSGWTLILNPKDAR